MNVFADPAGPDTNMIFVSLSNTNFKNSFCFSLTPDELFLKKILVWNVVELMDFYQQIG